MTTNRIKDRVMKPSQRRFLQHLKSYKRFLIKKSKSEIEETNNIVSWLDVLINSIDSENKDNKRSCGECGSMELRHRINGGYFCKRCGFNFKIGKEKKENE
jgi:hypothetical protein